MKYPLLYPIINLCSGEEIDETYIKKIVKNCSEGFIQLRMKDASHEEVLRNGRKLLEFLDLFESNLIPVLNDFVDLAHILGFPYLHIGQDDMSVSEVKSRFPHLKIGLSTHTIEQFYLAQESGADYIAFGPVFETKSKNTGYSSRLYLVDEIQQHKTTDIVFIGGITPENIGQLPSRKGFHAALISSLPSFLSEVEK
ncbi:thiamine phosphate synthase [bacterium]|nr:thiamine phosphate synthase [bacterium]